MEPIVTINAARLELTVIAVELGNNIEGIGGAGADDFERLLNREIWQKEQQGRESLESEGELKRARRELEEGLASQRERVKEELKKGRSRKGDIEEGDVLDKESLETDLVNEKDKEKFGADRVDTATSRRAVVVAGSLLPAGYKNQLGAKLMSSGKTENALNSYLLTGGRPTELLKEMLESVGTESGMWNLEGTAFGDLKDIFLASGLEEQEASELIADLTGGEVTLDRVLLVVRQADAIAMERQAPGEGFLTVTAGGMNSFGQYLMSLGLSTETVKAVTSSLAPGEKFSASDLRSILSESGEILAPALSGGDLPSLFAAFKAMGADQASLSQLADFLGQSQGQASLEDLIGFMSFTEQSGQTAMSAEKVAASIQNLLAQTNKDSELVKAPLFNEIVLKLAALGDRELSSDFSDLSPALQALRGGLSGLREGGSGSFNQGGRDSGWEREERLMAMNGIRSETVGRGLSDTVFRSTLAQSSYGTGETLVKQLEQKLLYSARRGLHRLKMDLEPESLGHLDVELKVKGDKLTASIVADSLEAYEALEKELSALKQSLLSAGLELSMTLSFDGKQGSSYARSGSDFQRRFSGEDEQADGPEEIEATEGGRLFDKVV